MISGRKVIVVMPAYNAAKTLAKTFREIPRHIVDHVVLVDDCSQDETVKIAKELGIHTILHKKNEGYGGNQKTCYDYALTTDADIVVMLHPDYQYTPSLISALCEKLIAESADVVLGSRFLSYHPLDGGMPMIKFICNIALTRLENLILGSSLSEFHTGYRVFSASFLRAINYRRFSDGFLFDNQMLVDAISKDAVLAEVGCPTKYFEDSSSISLISSAVYAIQCIFIAVKSRIKGFQSIGASMQKNLPHS